MRLAKPIDFDSMDQEPVDFVVGLLVPDGSADEHVQTLAELAGLRPPYGEKMLKAVKMQMR